MANNTVSIVFNRKAFTFSRATLEAKVKKMAKQNPPTTSALHSIILPGFKAAVSPNWAATFILDCPAVIPNKIAIETNGKGIGSALRGAYNPGQVLAAFSKMADIGVKVSSVSRSKTYAAYSPEAAKTMQAALQKMLGNSKVKPEAKTAKTRKPARKVKPVEVKPVEVKPE